MMNRKENEMTVTESLEKTPVEIQEVKICRDMPVSFRRKEYLRQIKNPYMFKCGEVKVYLSFSQNGKPLKEALKDCLYAVGAYPPCDDV